jgi:hypothetical protein
MAVEKIHHDLLAEIKKLNIRLDHANKRPAIPTRHGWLKVFVKDLENNPKTQASIHKWACVYWLVNFPIIFGLFFFAPHVWVAIAMLINTAYSLYANFATDYGALSAAQSYGSALEASQSAHATSEALTDAVDAAS